MKQTLVLLLAVVVVTMACSRQPEMQDCYVCQQNDSVTSNIPALDSPHYFQKTAMTCSLTVAQKNFLVLQNTKTDTLYFKNDTIRIGHWTMNCDLY